MQYSTACRHTTQGVDVEPYTIVQGPQDWKAAEFRGPENAHKWQTWLTAEDIAEVRRGPSLHAQSASPT